MAMRLWASFVGVFVAALCTSAGCGSSGRAFDDAPQGASGVGPGASGDGVGGFGAGGAKGTLNCKGLSDGTKSSSGCDYYIVVPDVILDGAGACFAAFLTNTSDEPVTFTVEYGGQAFVPAAFSYIPTGSG